MSKNKWQTKNTNIYKIIWEIWALLRFIPTEERSYIAKKKNRT